MFDFTKEVVINNKNFEVVESPAGKKMRVHGGGEYFSQYIVSQKVYKTMARDAKLATLAIDADGLVSAISNDQKHFSLNIELTLDKDARGDWASAVYYFKNPMLIDAYAASWADAGDELYKLLSAVLTDYKFVHVLHGEFDAAFAAELGVEGYDPAKVYVVGADCHVKVRKVSVIEYNCDSRCEGTSEEPSVIYSGKASLAPEYMAYTDNVVEFGTYNYLLQNLRMPTYENYRFTSPAAVEMPMVGAKYVQFTFLYCVPRPGLGGLSVAGQYNHSTTTHVFFVEESVAGDFEAMFASMVPVVSTSEIETDPGHDAHTDSALHEPGYDNVGGADVVDGDAGETTI